MKFLGTKKFRDADGNIYTKIHESQKKTFFACNNDGCSAHAHMNKQTDNVDYIGNHNHETPNQNDIRVLLLTTHLKSAALISKDSGLLLFKKAVAAEFKGISLQPDYKAKILESIRNIRKYDKSKAKRVQQVNNSPMSPDTVEPPQEMLDEPISTIPTKNVSYLNLGVRIP